MSYAAALERVSELEGRFGISFGAGSVSNVDNRNFDKVFATAQNRFVQGPEALKPGASSEDLLYSKAVPQGAQASRVVLPTATPGAASSAYAAAAGAVSTGGKVPAELEATFNSIAAKHGVPVALVKAVARAESGFRANAVSHAGAQGMMQLMPATGRGLGVTDPFDPAQSIEGGTRYLKNALRMFDGDVKLALAAYNAGPGAVQKYGGIPPYTETQNYVTKVMGYAREYGLQV